MKIFIFGMIFGLGITLFVVRPAFEVDSVKGNADSDGSQDLVAEARKAWWSGESDFLIFFESLDNDLQREMAMNALRTRLSQHPKLALTLIEKGKLASWRNSWSENLLEELYDDRSPEAAVNFVIVEFEEGRSRTNALTRLYTKWFEKSPEGAIRGAKMLSTEQDLVMYEMLLEGRGNRVTRHECDLAIDAGLSDRFQRRFAGIYVKKIGQQYGQKAVAKMFDSDAVLASLVTE